MNVKPSSKVALTEEDAKEFVSDLITFLKGSIIGTSDSFGALIEIERKHPDLYNILRSVKMDYESMDDVLDNLNEKQRDVLMLIFFKTSSLGKKMNRLFDLTLEEKIKLVSDLKDFSEFVNKKLKEMGGIE